MDASGSCPSTATSDLSDRDQQLATTETDNVSQEASATTSNISDPAREEKCMTKLHNTESTELRETPSTDSLVNEEDTSRSIKSKSSDCDAMVSYDASVSSNVPPRGTKSSNDDTIISQALSERKVSSPSPPGIDTIRPATSTEHSTSLQNAKVFVPLSLPTDNKWLSGPLCLVRSQMEIVAMTKYSIDALEKPSFGRGGRLDRIVAANGHVVAVRCGWCAHVPYRERARGAVSFPESIAVLHQTVRNFKRYHFKNCGHMPREILDEMAEYDKKPKYWQSKKGSDAYWYDSAKHLGLVNLGGVDKGMCFSPLPVRSLNDEDDDKISASSAGKSTSDNDAGSLSSSSSSNPSGDVNMLSVLAAAARDESVQPDDDKASDSSNNKNKAPARKFPSLPLRKRKYSDDDACRQNKKVAVQA